MHPPSPTRDRRPTPATPRLTLVPSSPRPTYSPLALWHLLSLDAPTVAATWTLFVARCSHIVLPWTAPVAMFLAVWMLYAADRLLDARHPDTSTLEDRHHFHHNHRKLFLTGIILASILLTLLIPHLDPAALRLYAVLATLLFAYFFLIHIYPANHRLPKELAVGLFFSAAIFIPTIARNPNLRLHLFPIALLFAAVCTLNCLYLYVWEHPLPTPATHWSTHFATQHLKLLTTTLIAAALVFAVALVFLSVILAGDLLLTAACTLSALLLLTLHINRHHLTRLHLRAAADLALLTPLLFLIASK